MGGSDKKIVLRKICSGFLKRGVSKTNKYDNSEILNTFHPDYILLFDGVCHIVIYKQCYFPFDL